MKITAQEIKSMNSPYLSFVTGHAGADATRPWSPEGNDLSILKGALVFVSTPELLKTSIDAGAGIIVATPSALQKKEIVASLKSHQALFSTPAINAAMAVLNPKFDTKAERWPPEISAQASIHPSAKIGKNVSIAPFAVVSENVVIGDGTRVGPNTVIEKNAKIGSKTYLHALVFIGADCEVGDECEIHPHTSIGSDGFGFATDENHINHKIPQLGKVIIEDRVEIGSNVAIDRATLHETRICAGAKLDNLIHFAHNCTVGPNSLIAAGFATAGSSKLGANFKCGGCVRMDHHVTVADNVSVGGNSVITKDITEPGSYVGFPLQPWKDGIRTLASLPSIPEMRKELAELKRQISELKK